MKSVSRCLQARLNRVLMISILSIISLAGFAQNSDTTLYFKGALSITQNGFSFIPSFSLGKPAAILDLAVGNKRLSFEPQFRFALEGRPWSFIFIYRYKFINRNKFQFSVGGHIPAILFRTQSTTGADDVIIAQRYLAGELFPTYTLSKDISIGMYFLRGHGFDEGGTVDTHFLGLRSSFSNIRLTERVYFKFNPQVYYLKTDDTDGTTQPIRLHWQ